MRCSMFQAAVPLFSIYLTAACASPAEHSTPPEQNAPPEQKAPAEQNTPPARDELAGETPQDAALDGTADVAASGVYTYFAIKSDAGACAPPLCGGFHLKRVNRTTTVCADGIAGGSCYTPELDFTESGLSQVTQDKLISAAANGAIGDGVKALVRGRFERTSSGPIPSELGRFVVTEAWIAQTDAISDGVFAKVLDGRLRCVGAPCPWMTEKGLNTSRSARIAEIDYSRAGLVDGQIKLQVVQPSGLIVAGHRFSFEISGLPGTGRTATAVFARLADAAAP